LAATFEKPDDRTDRESVWLSEYRDTDVAGERGCDHRARLYRRAVEETDQAHGCKGNIGRGLFGHYPLQQPSLALAGILLSATISLYLKGKCA